jgi:hypothetical protein
MFCIWKTDLKNGEYETKCGGVADVKVFNQAKTIHKTIFCPFCGNRISFGEDHLTDQAPDKIWLTLDYAYGGENYYDWADSPNVPEDIPYIKTEVVAEALAAINEDVGSDELAPLSRGCEILKRAMENA